MQVKVVKLSIYLQIHTEVHGKTNWWRISTNIYCTMYWIKCNAKKNSPKLHCILQYKNPISHFLLPLAFLHNTVNEILPSCQKKIPIVRKQLCRWLILGSARRFIFLKRQVQESSIVIICHTFTNWKHFLHHKQSIQVAQGTPECATSSFTETEKGFG